MRFRYSKAKSEKLQKNPNRGIGFEEPQEIFAHPYYLDKRLDDPEQHRAIGWAKGRLYTLILEVREDYMMQTSKTKKHVSAESIAQMADRGKDVSGFFTNRGKMMQPIQRVNVDFTAAMLQELDHTAAELNVSRQAVIKAFVRQALDQHHLAQKARKARLG
jgi:hypothetical protein